MMTFIHVCDVRMYIFIGIINRFNVKKKKNTETEVKVLIKRSFQN